MPLVLLLLYLFVLGSHALIYHGADISSLLLVESQGVHFTDGGRVSPFENIFVAHGGNAARVRVWTAGEYCLSYGLQMAKRVKAAGMVLVVDLHFSDTCGYRSYLFEISMILTGIFDVCRGRSWSPSYSFKLANHIVWPKLGDLLARIPTAPVTR